jgi:hypothetical protein
MTKLGCEGSFHVHHDVVVQVHWSLHGLGVDGDMLSCIQSRAVHVDSSGVGRCEKMWVCGQRCADARGIKCEKEERCIAADVY